MIAIGPRTVVPCPSEASFRLDTRACRGLIPTSIGLLRHGRRPYRYIWNTAGKPERIPTASFCVVRHQGSESLCLFPRASDASTFEAILLWARTHWTSTRTDKFFSAYRASEALSISPGLTARSIRHSLAHSTTRLRDPEVLATLERIFGGTSIDLDRHGHRRAFYGCLGDLLQLVDLSLYERLVSTQHLWLRLRSEGALVLPFEERALGLDGAI